MSPEQVGAEGTLDYSSKVDSWGLGVIAYELLHDKMPFRLVWLNILLLRFVFCAGTLFQNLSVTLHSGKLFLSPYEIVGWGVDENNFMLT